jgi:hypothetical protein
MELNCSVDLVDTLWPILEQPAEIKNREIKQSEIKHGEIKRGEIKHCGIKRDGTKPNEFITREARPRKIRANASDKDLAARMPSAGRGE